MSRKWKPGDVALIPFGAGPKRAIRDEDGTWLVVGKANSKGYSDARPLVVIDPEDREQVERLDDIYQRALDLALPFHSLADVMQAAVREFANPTPPKPDEPMGLGAVVEDEAGTHWVRADRDVTVPNPQGRFFFGSGGRGWKRYDAIKATRVLSPGYTEDGAS
jgi:hypothetical protein